jgi:hypothetical protein
VASHAALSRALEFLEEYADVVVGRVASVSPPAFVEARGWDAFLGALSESDLERAETDAAAFLLSARDAPPSLRRFVAASVEVTRLERLEPEERPVSKRERQVKQRKSSQIEALVSLLKGLAAEVDRIVDVGTGMGHLSRIASERWQRGALGLRARACVRVCRGEAARVLRGKRAPPCACPCPCPDVFGQRCIMSALGGSLDVAVCV